MSRSNVKVAFLCKICLHRLQCCLCKYNKNTNVTTLSLLYPSWQCNTVSNLKMGKMCLNVHIYSNPRASQCKLQALSVFFLECILPLIKKPSLLKSTWGFFTPNVMCIVYCIYTPKCLYRSDTPSHRRLATQTASLCPCCFTFCPATAWIL